MESKKVKFSLERVYNYELEVYEVIIHREGDEDQRVGLARLDIALVAVVANAMTCQFDALGVDSSYYLDFELLVKKHKE